jgi:hypothetical protein
MGVSPLPFVGGIESGYDLESEKIDNPPEFPEAVKKFWQCTGQRDVSKTVECGL